MASTPTIFIESQVLCGHGAVSEGDGHIRSTRRQQPFEESVEPVLAHLSGVVEPNDALSVDATRVGVVLTPYRWWLASLTGVDALPSGA